MKVNDFEVVRIVGLVEKTDGGLVVKTIVGLAVGAEVSFVVW